MTNPAKKDREPTDAQWEAVRVTDSHMLVSAGAGTGKTFTVVSHILYLMGVEMRGQLHAPPLDLDEIAAITFTNKAAAELKEQLRDGLRVAGRREDAYRVDGARVGTIHGFCGDILREFALRGSLSPHLTLLDEPESKVLRAQCVRDTLLEVLEAVPGSPESVEGLVALLGEYSVGEVEHWVRELLEQGDHLRGIVDCAGELPERERSLVSLAHRTAASFDALLRDRRAMDFDRMITWTRDLIRDDETVRRSLRRRIRVLIIDEFQDVDPVQREIAYLLGDPASVSATSTRLMLVGDPKQSIYSFRKADMRGWQTVERDFRDNGWGVVVPIADSRRSVRPVLAFVDHAIGALLNQPIGASSVLRDFEVPYAAVNPIRSDGPADRAVEFLSVPANDDGCSHSVGIVRESEAHAVASRALALHSEGDGMRWSDMAVLLSGWGDLETYQGALEAVGIPTYALKSEGFYETREILDLIVALEAIRSASDDRALLGFLRSPFIGVTDETLLRVANQLPSPVWPRLAEGGALLIPDATERMRLDTAVALIKRLSALRDRIPTRALLEELLQETAYLAHLALLGEPGRQAIANVRKLQSLAETSADASLGSFLNSIASARELRVKEGNARLYGENDDVLTITSIHSAKGLEWKVVFWCDLVREKHNRTSPLLVGGTRVSLSSSDRENGDDGSGDDESDVADEGRAQLMAALNDERDAETKRLWYVAATRAKDRLLVCIPAGSSKKARESARKREKAGEAPERNFRSAADAMKLIFPTLGASASERYRSSDNREFEAVVHVLPLVDPEADKVAPQPRALDVTSLAAPPELIDLAAGRSRHSATELLSEERCGKRHWFKYVAGIREPEFASSEPASEINAITRGLIVHDVLERLRENDELDALLEDAVGRHDSEAPSPEQVEGKRYRDRIRDEVTRVLAQPDYRAVFDAPGAQRELGFLHIVNADTYIEGKIDIVAPGADGYRVIDVKTSQCDPDAAPVKAEQYAIQKAVYVNALEAIGGEPVAEFGFQFSAIAIHIGGPMAANARAQLDARLASVLAKLGEDPPSLARSANDCRYCGYRTAGWCPGIAAIAVLPIEESP